MILIVASTKDIAGMNIAQRLIDNHGFEKIEETFFQNPVYSRKMKGREAKLVLVNEEIVDTQFVTKFLGPKLLVFISKHRSVSGLPTLSVHTPGNFAEAEMGGIPKKVSISPASAMRDALLQMATEREEMKLEYEVSYECTHHGPSLDVPTMFVELGSSLKQWRDQRAAEAVARAVVAAATKESRYTAVLGIGGPHYNAKFTRIALSTPTAFGHMIPKYAIPRADAGVVRQCVERTVESVELAILDWKGIKGSDKKRLMAILNKVGVSIEKA